MVGAQKIQPPAGAACSIFKKLPGKHRFWVKKAVRRPMFAQYSPPRKIRKRMLQMVKAIELR